MVQPSHAVTVPAFKRLGPPESQTVLPQYSCRLSDMRFPRDLPDVYSVQGEEDRRRTQEAINTVFAHITGAAMGLISNPRCEVHVRSMYSTSLRW